MRQKKLISLEQLEYEVYKNENEIRIKKLNKLDDYFKISVGKPPTRAQPPL
jgi:hypothetical protein